MGLTDRSPFRLSLKRDEELPNPLGSELDQLAASVQTGLQNFGQWVQLGLADLKFSGDGGMLWTVAADDLADPYGVYAMRLGQTLLLSVRISTFSVSAPLSTKLLMTLPAGLIASRNASAACLVFDNSLVSGVAGFMRALAGNNYLEIYRADEAVLTASVSNSALLGQILLEVQ